MSHALFRIDSGRLPTDLRPAKRNSMCSARIQAHPGFLALAADFDGTLASDSRVGPSTIDALKKWGDSGRRLILVTGRQLEELLRVFPGADLFDWVVAAWCYHLRRGDFAQWIESTVKNETLTGACVSWKVRIVLHWT